MEPPALDNQSDRAAPDISLESLRNGRTMDLDARDGGFIWKHVKAGERQVINLLASRLPVQRRLTRELPQLCRWVRLAVRFRQRDIFCDLLERHSDVVRNGAVVNYPLLFATMVFWENAEPEEDLLIIVLEWFQGLGIPLSKVRGLKRFTVGGKRHPLYLAFQKRRFDLVDVFLALGASLQDRPSGRRSIFQMIYEELDRTDLSKLVDRALTMRSSDVISMDDIVGILLNWSHKRVMMSRRDVEVDMYHGDYMDLVGWSKPKGSTERLLKWRSPYDLSNTALWAQLARAGKTRLRLLRAEKAVSDNLVLHAALQANWPAVRCLLDMGFSPNGTGSYWYSTAHHVYELPLTPLDVAEWTSYVPDKHCAESGLQLKRNNRAIARLLRERGASPSGAYTVANLAATPFLTTWEYFAAEFSDTTHHNGRIGLFFSTAGFLVGLVSLWLLWYLAGLVTSFTGLGEALYLLFWCLAIPNVVLICWAVLWLPLQVLVRGHRKRAYAKLVHGGNLRAFWVASFGNGNAVTRFLGRMVSGWREQSSGDKEVDGPFDDQFEQETVKEYEAIAEDTPTTRIQPSLDKKAPVSPIEDASQSEEAKTIKLSIQNKTFRFPLGSPDPNEDVHGGSMRRRVRFENEVSASDGETTPLLIQGEPNDVPQRQASPESNIRVATTWLHDGRCAHGPEIGVTRQSAARRMPSGDEQMAESPAWSGQDSQWSMFLLNGM